MIWWLPNGLIFRWHGFHLQHNCGKLLPNSKFLIWSLFSKYAGNPYKKKIGIFGRGANSSNVRTTYKKLPMTLLVLLFWHLSTISIRIIGLTWKNVDFFFHPWVMKRHETFSTVARRCGQCLVQKRISSHPDGSVTRSWFSWNGVFWRYLINPKWVGHIFCWHIISDFVTSANIFSKIIFRNDSEDLWLHPRKILCKSK